MATSEATAVPGGPRRCALQGDPARRAHLRRDAQGRRCRRRCCATSNGTRSGTTSCTPISTASPPIETITLDVKVELRGTAPGIAAGGVLVQQIHSLHVECLIVNIPESIRVNVAELQIDQAIRCAI